MVAKTPKETNTPHTPSRAHVSRCIRLPRTFTVAKTATETANNGHAHLDTSTQPHTSIAAKTPKGTDTAHTQSWVHVSRHIRPPRTFIVAKVAITQNVGHTLVDTPILPHTSIVARTPK